MKRLIPILFAASYLWGDGTMWGPSEQKRETKTVATKKS